MDTGTREEQKCFFCEQSLTDGAVMTVRERGIQTFIESSEKRKDGFHVQLRKFTTMVVHDACRKNYNDPRTIVAAIRKSILEEESLAVKCRFATPTFAFKGSCFICGIDLDDDCL